MADKGIEALGKRTEMRRGMVVAVNEQTGLKNMVEGLVPITFVSSTLTPEEAQQIPAEVWQPTPEALKPSHPAFMAKYQGRRFFCDKPPVKAEPKPEPEKGGKK